MRLYLDTCCLSRLDDDQTQERIRAEAGGVVEIVAACERGEHDWIASAAVVAEARSNPDLAKRANALARLQVATELLLHNASISARARDLLAAGLGTTDAYHLAFAEAGQCDVLFTTDDRFAVRARRLTPPSRVAVYNPTDWPELTP